MAVDAGDYVVPAQLGEAWQPEDVALDTWLEAWLRSDAPDAPMQLRRNMAVLGRTWAWEAAHPARYPVPYQDPPA